MAGKPIKVLVVDTQVYSNTGGQACTSGFIGQVSDMAQYGRGKQGKTEKRKEISADRHGAPHVVRDAGLDRQRHHLMEGFIDGLNSRRPALFNVYAVVPSRNTASATTARSAQSKLAVESRAYPAVPLRPRSGVTFAECVDLEGNPSLDADWPTYKLDYVDETGAQEGHGRCR